MGRWPKVTRSVSPTGEWVAWAGAERTSNICHMLVTRDVSKLSGWLNARAYCRESKGRHSMRTIRRARRRKGAGTVAYN